jgi:predicted aspartyl protease
MPAPLPRSSATRSFLRARCSLALSMLVALAAACQPDDAAVGRRRVVDTTAGEVGIEIAGPGGAVLLIPVFINGQGPFELVLDTGATMTCLDQVLAERLRLPPRFAQPSVGLGVAGSGQVPIVRLDSLRTGAVSATGVSACVLDLAHLKALGPKVDGLLGLNFLRSYRVTLDFPRNVARLEKR